MCVLGAVFVEKVIVQPLTGFMWTGATTDDGLNSLARCFNALRDGLRTLDDFYGGLKIVPSDQHIYPFHRSYTDSQKRTVFFKYIRRLHETKHIYLAENEADGVRLVVKFVEHYNEKAHKLLAEFNLAPKLVHYSDAEYWPYGVVVMEYVKGETVHERYGPTDTFPEHIYAQVKTAIDKLHQESIVFGDLRRANIMITDDDDKVKVIDFDWCGEDGMGKYPPSLNDSIGWHQGVERNGIMLKAHDTHMLDMLQGLGDDDVVIA